MFREIRESLGRINPIKIDTNKENYSLTNKIKWLKNDSLLRKKRRASDKITVSHQQSPAPIKKLAKKLKLTRSKGKIQTVLNTPNLSDEEKPKKSSIRIQTKGQSEQFSQIFDILDGDKDGKISLASINIDQLDDALAKLTLPIFEDLSNASVVLSKGEFITRGLRYFQGLKMLEKRTILNWQADENPYVPLPPSTHHVRQKSQKSASKLR